jgi:hypothetical protein
MTGPTAQERDLRTNDKQESRPSGTQRRLGTLRTRKEPTHDLPVA